MKKNTLKRGESVGNLKNVDLAAELRQLRKEFIRRNTELENLQNNFEALRKATCSAHDGVIDALYDLESNQLIASSNEAKSAYFAMVRRIQKTVHQLVPREATLAVVSKGDELLTKLYGRRAWHFPQGDEGTYAGFNPASKTEAIAQIEEAREKGADYIVFPATAYWWFDHYSLRQYLERKYRLAHRSEDACAIFALGQASPWLPLADLISKFKSRHQRCPAILNWKTGVDFAAIFSECAVFAPLNPGADRLLYMDKSVDLVAISADANHHMNEALRVATEAVLCVSEESTLVIEKKANGTGRASRKSQPRTRGAVPKKTRAGRTS